MADLGKAALNRVIDLSVQVDNAIKFRTVNMFNKGDLRTGEFYYASVGSAVALSTSSNWSTLNTPLSVKAGDVVNFNLAYQNAYFVGTNDSGVVQQIGGSLGTAGATNVTVAAGVTKLYVSSYKDYIDTFMVTINNPMPSQFTPYYNNPNSKWTGKTLVTLGDSVTWQDGQAYTQGNVGAIAKGYQTILKQKLGFASCNNQGVSGRSMADGTVNGVGTVTTGLALTYSSYDLVIIAAGTNDFKLNVVLGSLGVIGDTTFDRNTFYGAYRTLIEYIINSKPTIRIVLFTPLQRDNGGYDVNFTNTASLKLIDYVNAIKSVGAMYGLPVCDMYSNSGITKLAMSTFLMDGLHPNDTGYARMGDYAQSFINVI